MNRKRWLVCDVLSGRWTFVPRVILLRTIGRIIGRIIGLGLILGIWSPVQAQIEITVPEPGGTGLPIALSPLANTSGGRINALDSPSRILSPGILICPVCFE